MLKIDTLVTMLACLATTPPNELTDVATTPVDTFENVTTGSCPISALSGLTVRLQQLTHDINGLKEQLGNLQEQMADLTRAGAGDKSTNPYAVGGSPGSKKAHMPAIRFASRFLDPVRDAHSPAAAPITVLASAAATPPNCLKQKHGVVRIRLNNNDQPFYVFCDQKTRGGGWIVIANRYDGSEDFNRNWEDFKNGFGSLNAEFFVGLEKLHKLTTNFNFELLIIVENRKQEQRYALFEQFDVGGEEEKYALNFLGKYEGDAEDGLRQHVGKKFTTKDQHNNAYKDNCAQVQQGGWWYGEKCTQSNLFGIYQRLLERDVDGFQGILWTGFLDGPKGSLKKMRMLMRPKAAEL